MNLYAININKTIDEQLVQLLLTKIAPKKRRRLEKFVFKKDLLRSLFADLLVRISIVNTYDISNEELRFSVNEFGKPYCVTVNNFHFNVSHSGDWVVCAIDEKPIGIDIEKTSIIDLDISKNFFSEKEHSDLLLSNDPHDYFFTLWSLKESYVKFIGKGLSHPLNSFSINLLNNKIYIESYNRILEDVYFKQYDIDEEYKMAVCSSNSKMPEKVLTCTVDDIIESFIISEKMTYK